MPRAGLSPERVTDIALGIVDQRGWDALSLAAVATEGGVKLPSLYKHVDGLAALRRLVSIRSTSHFADALVASVMGKAGDDALRALAHAYRSFATAFPGRYEASLVAPAIGDADHEAQARRAFEAVSAALSGYRLDEAATVHAIRIVRATLHGFVSLEAAGGFGMPVSIDESFEILTHDLTRLLR